eukprot:139454-Pelagomonas_calceolata.AAC.1
MPAANDTCGEVSSRWARFLLTCHSCCNAAEESLEVMERLMISDVGCQKAWPKAHSTKNWVRRWWSWRRGRCIEAASARWHCLYGVG